MNINNNSVNNISFLRYKQTKKTATKKGANSVVDGQQNVSTNLTNLNNNIDPRTPGFSTNGKPLRLNICQTNILTLDEKLNNLVALKMFMVWFTQQKFANGSDELTKRKIPGKIDDLTPVKGFKIAIGLLYATEDTETWGKKIIDSVDDRIDTIIARQRISDWMDEHALLWEEKSVVSVQGIERLFGPMPDMKEYYPEVSKLHEWIGNKEDNGLAQDFDEELLSSLTIREPRIRTEYFSKPQAYCTPGAASKQKISGLHKGMKKMIRCSKTQYFSSLTKDSFLEKIRPERIIGDRAFVNVKKEPMKMRLFINTGIDSHIAMTPLYHYIKDGLKQDQHVYATMSDNSKIRAFRMMKERIGQGVCFPADQSSFDQHIPLSVVKKTLVTVVKMIMAKDQDIERKQIITRYLDATLRVLDNTMVEYEGVSYKAEGGILSGWRLTALIDSLVNLYIWKKLEKMTNYKMENILVMGDDVTMNIMTEDNFDTILRTVLQESEKLGIVISPSKNFLSTKHTTFLRTFVSPKGLFRYIARGVYSLIFAKYESGEDYGPLEWHSSAWEYVNRLGYIGDVNLEKLYGVASDLKVESMRKYYRLWVNGSTNIKIETQKWKNSDWLTPFTNLRCGSWFNNIPYLYEMWQQDFGSIVTQSMYTRYINTTTYISRLTWTKEKIKTMEVKLPTPTPTIYKLPLKTGIPDPILREATREMKPHDFIQWILKYCGEIKRARIQQYAWMGYKILKIALGLTNLWKGKNNDIFDILRKRCVADSLPGLLRLIRNNFSYLGASAKELSYNLERSNPGNRLVYGWNEITTLV